MLLFMGPFALYPECIALFKHFKDRDLHSLYSDFKVPGAGDCRGPPSVGDEELPGRLRVTTVTMAVPLTLVLLPLMVGQAQHTINDINVTSSSSPKPSDGWKTSPPETEPPSVPTRTSQSVTADVPPSCHRASPQSHR
ncbi:hypothetical protein MRX96_058131 [Rhipicephalus microplus]